MKLGFTTRLGVKITVYLLIGLTIFAILLIAFITNSINTRRQVERDLYKVHGQTMIRTFSSAIIFGLLSQNQEVLDHEVEKLFGDRTISYVVIYNDSSEEVLKKHKEEVSAQEFEAPSSAPGEEIHVDTREDAGGEEFLDFLMVVRSEEGSFGIPSRDDRPIGWVRIGISLQTLNHQIRNSQTYGALLILALMVLGAFLILFIQRGVIPPINRLAAAARRISEGDYDIRVDVISEDEIGLLAMWQEHIPKPAGRKTYEILFPCSRCMVAEIEAWVHETPGDPELLR